MKTIARPGDPFDLVRIVDIRSQGLLCTPTAGNYPEGWGEPFKDAEGAPIHPPLGTYAPASGAIGVELSAETDPKKPKALRVKRRASGRKVGNCLVQRKIGKRWIRVSFDGPFNRVFVDNDLQPYGWDVGTDRYSEEPWSNYIYLRGKRLYIDAKKNVYDSDFFGKIVGVGIRDENTLVLAAIHRNEIAFAPLDISKPYADGQTVSVAYYKLTPQVQDLPGYTFYPGFAVKPTPPGFVFHGPIYPQVDTPFEFNSDCTQASCIAKSYRFPDTSMYVARRHWRIANGYKPEEEGDVDPEFSDFVPYNWANSDLADDVEAVITFLNESPMETVINKFGAARLNPNFKRVPFFQRYLHDVDLIWTRDDKNKTNKKKVLSAVQGRATRVDAHQGGESFWTPNSARVETLNPHTATVSWSTSKIYNTNPDPAQLIATGSPGDYDPGRNNNQRHAGESFADYTIERGYESHFDLPVYVYYDDEDVKSFIRFFGEDTYQYTEKIRFHASGVVPVGEPGMGSTGYGEEISGSSIVGIQSHDGANQKVYYFGSVDTVYGEDYTDNICRKARSLKVYASHPYAGYPVMARVTIRDGTGEPPPGPPYDTAYGMNGVPGEFFFISDGLVYVESDLLARIIWMDPRQNNYLFAKSTHQGAWYGKTVQNSTDPFFDARLSSILYGVAPGLVSGEIVDIDTLEQFLGGKRTTEMLHTGGPETEGALVRCKSFKSIDYGGCVTLPDSGITVASFKLPVWHESADPPQRLRYRTFSAISTGQQLREVTGLSAGAPGSYADFYAPLNLY